MKDPVCGMQVDPAKAARPIVEPEVIDPVCGMSIRPAHAVGHVTHRGQTSHFCGQSCLDTFRASPETCVSPESNEPRPHAPGDTREYTCPMDLEVRQIGPGSCPKCGEALEPVSAAPLTTTEWTCPMHPEILRDEPGSCPLCGMALEPRVVALAANLAPAITASRVAPAMVIRG